MRELSSVFIRLLFLVLCGFLGSGNCGFLVLVLVLGCCFV